MVAPAAIGAVVTAASILAVRDRGGTETIRRAGVIAVLGDYAACIIGIVTIYNTGIIDRYQREEYAIAWAIICSVVAYGVIVGTAVLCWNHPWRYP